VNEYRLKLSPAVKKYVRSLHPLIRRDLQAAFVRLVKAPDSGKPLRGELAGLWSFKVRRFRVIYRIEDGFLILVAVGPGSTIYKETEKERKT